MFSNAFNNFVGAVTKTRGSHNALFELLEKSHELLSKNISALDNLFNNFEIEKFTCLHAAILRAKYTTPSPLDKELLILQTRSFFEQCNELNAQKISAHVRFISQEFTHRLISWGLAVRGIQPITLMLRKLQGSPEQLTALHADLCQLALEARFFKPVLPVLNQDVLEIDKNYSFLDARDYLLYFYYGGMIYSALKIWDRALHFFELCLIIPQQTLSAILVEAAKKVILISLLHRGKFTTSLEVSAPHLSSVKQWKSFCRPYVLLSTAFQKGSPENLASVVESERHVFVADSNYGLVKQVVKSHVKFRIHNLTKTFMTMSLSDVANRVKLQNAEEAERYLVEMIESKAIFARIDQRNGTVYFLDNPEKYDSLEMLTSLEKKIQECVVLEKHMMSVSDRLVQSPTYARKMLQLETSKTVRF